MDNKLNFFGYVQNEDIREAQLLKVFPGFKQTFRIIWQLADIHYLKSLESELQDKRYSQNSYQLLAQTIMEQLFDIEVDRLDYLLMLARDLVYVKYAGFFNTTELYTYFRVEVNTGLDILPAIELTNLTIQGLKYLSIILAYTTYVFDHRVTSLVFTLGTEKYIKTNIIGFEP